MIQNLNPPQFGTQIEFLDEETVPGVSSAAACGRCDSSSRCGASGKSSSSSRCGVTA
ncbi:UNVERIFIED_ORG: phazolicin family TOMM bacteriocin [Roseateles sp. XES5]|uniref:phazolicin family TOMM bacteriocin n=1 Tax=Shinella sp. G-2 TaxID=3133141 RepID=UPI001D01CE2C|nr:phazolicin family TOMM bacteriocin [Roseateles sp. XES5]